MCLYERLFCYIYIAYFVSLLLHVLKHRINKNVILQNIHFTTNKHCKQKLTDILLELATCY